MIDWGLALKIFTFGLSAVFGSLALLIGAIYAFGKILKTIEEKGGEKG
jgi:Na+-transporting methylmalonyl-CoA/oxaloacetate decarboxylase gamma subunit